MSDHHDHGHHEPDTRGLAQEADEDMSLKIREISLIKHHPKLFWLYPWNLSTTYATLGGIKTDVCGILGGGFAWWYY